MQPSMGLQKVGHDWATEQQQQIAFRSQEVKILPVDPFTLVWEVESEKAMAPHGLPARLLCPRGSPGKNTGVGSHFLLQEIFPTQGSNPLFLHWQADSYS